MFNLTVIQYDVLMQAINNAKNELADGTFIDPYAEMPKGYNSETLTKALLEVEEMLISNHIPL